MGYSYFINDHGGYRYHQWQVRVQGRVFIRGASNTNPKITDTSFQIYNQTNNPAWIVSKLKRGLLINCQLLVYINWGKSKTSTERPPKLEPEQTRESWRWCCRIRRFLSSWWRRRGSNTCRRSSRGFPTSKGCSRTRCPSLWKQRRAQRRFLASSWGCQTWARRCCSRGRRRSIRWSRCRRSSSEAPKAWNQMNNSLHAKTTSHLNLSPNTWLWVAKKSC